MITEIELKNVRIFDEKGIKFSLPELSIFCGTNSSGKSTILKSLLLLRQSQGIQESSGTPQGRLRFVGSQVDLGNYSSFVFNGETHRDMSIGITIEDKMPVRTYSRLRSLNGETDINTNEDKSNIKYHLKTHFTFTTASSSQELSQEDDDILAIAGDEDVVSSYALPAIVKSSTYEIVVNDEILLSWKVLLASDSTQKLKYEILLPENYIKDIGGPFEKMKFEHSEETGFVSTSAVLNGLLPRSLVGKISSTTENKNSDAKDDEKWGLFPLPPLIDSALGDWHRAMHNIHYLGPLRSPARRHYIANLDARPSLDTTGDFLPYILRDKDKDNEPLVTNMLPGDSTTTREKLSTSLNSWLYYLRVGDKPPKDIKCEEIAVSTLKGVLVEFDMKTVSGKGSFPLADSGFGYSQVLPILVRGLLARPNSLLIVEQPELHLNPALHVRIAEFFVAMAKAGKQIIIETHSEHIVNTVRVLSAEDETGKLSSKSSIFFVSVEKSKISVRELSIKSDGTVPDWPANFFGEAISLTGRLLRAQKHFRKRRA